MNIHPHELLNVGPKDTLRTLRIPSKHPVFAVQAKLNRL